ncbi:nitroreductase [Methanolobus sp. ZRKC3]|uniref:nitroreductase family protein n=1 Tax=Methanolobus sp. ZRKC3 TaxID=3125786 RepID=UPI00324D0625
MSGEKDVILNNIKTRASVREYENRPLSGEDITEIINAGIHAPTAFDAQPWFFVVVQNKEMMKRMSDHCKPDLLSQLEDATNDAAIQYKKNLATDEFNIFYDAPVLVIVLGSSEGFTTEYDCCLCAENMMLAAHAMDIGSCWVGTACFIQDNPEFLDELGIPSGYRIIAPIVFGYAKDNVPATPRKDPVVVWVK